jgi:hypothetical protein
VKPLARVEGVIAEQVDAELVIYDQQTRVAHCLSPSAAAVFRAADGTRSADELAGRLGLELGEVTQALMELSACGLLVIPSAGGGGFSRREVAARLGKLGVAAALVYSVDIAPAWASSSVGCVSDAECEAKLPHVESATCSNNTCTNLVCFSGFGDCDGNNLTGCETNLNTDANNCGGCGHQCPSFVANGTYVCAAGTCAIECNSTFTNCSGACVNLQTDRNNCGTCGHTCTVSQTCSSGSCITPP